MISKSEILEWIQNIEAEQVAIDDGGISLIGLSDDGPTGEYIEVGMTPEEEEL